MARSNNLVPGGGGTGGRILALLVVVAVVTVIVRFPAESAGWVDGTLGWIGDGIDGIATFIRTLASKNGAS